MKKIVKETLHEEWHGDFPGDTPADQGIRAAKRDMFTNEIHEELFDMLDAALLDYDVPEDLLRTISDTIIETYDLS